MKYCAGILFLLTVAVVASDPLEELDIEVVYKPDECEKKSKANDELHMHYTGTLLKDGSKFDSSLDREEPFKFQIGTGQVIKGWDEGLLDMCEGEKRILRIPAKMGYGDRGAGSAIPPNSDLKFEVELLGIQEGQAPRNVFKEIDSDGDNLLSQGEVSGYVKKAMKEAGQEVEEGKQEEHDQMIAGIFGQEDKDKDGFISYNEFSGPKHEEL